MKKEQEEIRHYVRSYIEQKMKPESPVEIEFTTELGRLDLVWESHYMGKFCANLIEIKTRKEMTNKNVYLVAVRELLYNSASIKYADKFKHCKYYTNYIATVKEKYGKPFAEAGFVKDLLKRYKIGLWLVDTKTKELMTKGCVHEKIKVRPRKLL
jgi:hypothetical protein